MKAVCAKILVHIYVKHTFTRESGMVELKDCTAKQRSVVSAYVTEGRH